MDHPENKLMQGSELRPHARDNGQQPSSLELAFIGDTVYDLYVRGRMVQKGGRVKDLHRQASALVCAKAQSQALSRIEPLLSEQEQGVVRRARNAKQNSPKNADPAEYHRATALEALLGSLYIGGQTERLDRLMGIILDDHGVEN